MNKFKYIFILNLCFILVSCTTTKYVEVPVETIKTEYVDKILRDSIYIDTQTEIVIINDTVYKTKIQYKYKEKYIKDTICTIDSIPKIVKVTEIQYTNKLNTFQKVFFYIGIGFSIIFIVILILKLKG